MRTVSGRPPMASRAACRIGDAELPAFGLRLGGGDRVLGGGVQPGVGDRHLGVAGDRGRAGCTAPPRGARPGRPAARPARRSAVRCLPTGCRCARSRRAGSGCPTIPPPRRRRRRQPVLTRSWTSAPRGHTVTRRVTGLAPHHLSLATSTTAPSLVTASSLYGPEDGKRFRSSSPLRFQVVFQAAAMRSIVGPSPAYSAVVTPPSPTPSSSAMTCAGIIDVAANSWPKSTNARSCANVTRAFFCPGAQSTAATSP